jgi:hypothetical protein
VVLNLVVGASSAVSSASSSSQRYCSSVIDGYLIDPLPVLLHPT